MFKMFKGIEIHNPEVKIKRVLVKADGCESLPFIEKDMTFHLSCYKTLDIAYLKDWQELAKIVKLNPIKLISDICKENNYTLVFFYVNTRNTYYAGLATEGEKPFIAMEGVSVDETLTELIQKYNNYPFDNHG